MAQEDLTILDHICVHLDAVHSSLSHAAFHLHHLSAAIKSRLETLQEQALTDEGDPDT